MDLKEKQEKVMIETREREGRRKGKKLTVPQFFLEYYPFSVKECFVVVVKTNE
jgi:hypothetical protein